MTPAERFWSKVQKADGCWLWTASRQPKGYGQLMVNGRPLVASRVSWELHNGPIPDGMCVLHRCDNPPCVNPDHLFLGTIADNNRDMYAKGRTWIQNHKRQVCKRGHALAGDNVRLSKSGARVCKECKRADCRARRASGYVAKERERARELYRERLEESRRKGREKQRRLSARRAAQRQEQQ